MWIALDPFFFTLICLCFVEIVSFELSFTLSVSVVYVSVRCEKLDYKSNDSQNSEVFFTLQ